MQVFSQNDITLLQGDTIALLPTLEPNSIDYCLTSPPYYFLCDYKWEGQTGLEPTLAQYLDTMSAVFSQVHKVLKEGGIFSIVIGDTNNNCSPARGKGDRRVPGAWEYRRPAQVGYKNKEPLHIPAKLTERLRADGWHSLPELIWDKVTSDRSTMAGTCSHEYILNFLKQTKGHRLKPAYLKPRDRSILSYKPVSDPVHPCPFPVPLAMDLISHSCPVKGMVLDPFFGSGSSGIAAYELNRQCVGIDLNCDRAIQRLNEAMQQMRLFRA